MDSLEFGHWPRDIDGDPEPIEWIVLDEVCGKKLLLSKEPLEHASYVNELPRRSGRKVWPTWGYSDLRYWLNTTFLSYAFSEVERMRIRPTNLGPQSRPRPLDFTRRSSDNLADAVAAVEESRDIVDYVFCLSAEEVDKYLGLGEGAAAVANPYVSAVIGKLRAACWWLRSNESGFYLVDAKGKTINRCDIPGNSMKAVRPALWLSSDTGDYGVQWTPGTRSHDYQVLSDYSLGQKQEWSEAIVNIAICYGDSGLAEYLLGCGEEILWHRAQAIFSTWVGTATLGNLMRRGIIRPEQHLDLADLALFWKQYSFLAEFYPECAIRSWSKIKVSPKAVRLIVPYLDTQTFKAKTQLGCILAENGYCDEIELLLGEDGKFFTKASLSKMRATAEEAGQYAVLRLLDEHM